MAAKHARFPCGVGACSWTARCSGSKFDDAASARGRDLMMRTAGARIMSISGARRAQTSPGLPADAHDAGFWGAKMGGTTARCTNSRCPHLAQPLNNGAQEGGDIPIKCLCLCASGVPNLLPLIGCQRLPFQRGKLMALRRSINYG